MSHITLEQAKELRELGFSQMSTKYIWSDQEINYEYETDWEDDFAMRERTHLLTMPGRKWYARPSAEELMEWLKNRNGSYKIVASGAEWWVDMPLVDDNYGFTHKRFMSDSLIDTLFQATCWVLEGKK